MVLCAGRADQAGKLATRCGQLAAASGRNLKNESVTAGPRLRRLGPEGIGLLRPRLFSA